MKVELREYQRQALETVIAGFYSKKAVLLRLPTGAGKTVIAGSVINRVFQLKPEAKVLVLLNKIDLLDQTVRFLRNFLTVSVSEVCGTNGRNDFSGQVVVASIQTISVTKSVLPVFNVVWTDEAHNADFQKGAYATLLSRIDHDRLKVFGTTATPWRQDGPIYGKDRIFEEVDFELPMSRLIEDGFLVRPVCKKTEEQFDTTGVRITAGEFNEKDLGRLATEEKTRSQVSNALPKLEGRKAVVWACINIEHAEAVAKELELKGELATVVHSKLSKEERKRNFDLFTSGERRHLSFVSIVSEGFDHPPTDAICFLRPTRSAVRYVQTVGRGLRPFGDKKDCLVLDYGRVIETLGPVDMPAVPKRRRPNGKKNILEVPPTKFCPACFSYLPVQTKTCPDCGHEFKTEVNLSKKSYEGDIMSQGGLVTARSSYNRLSVHVAKSGATCVKVTYSLGIEEYFIWANEYSFRRMSDRLAALGVLVLPTPEETASQKIEGVFDVTYAREGRFYRVKRVKRAEYSESDSGHSEQKRNLLLGK